jgi:hypothetical protein
LLMLLPCHQGQPSCQGGQYGLIIIDLLTLAPFLVIIM